jgi:ABC-2 type transport system permease protein
MSPAMNADSDLLPQSHATPATEIPASRQLYWLLKRELWENRTVWLSMIAIAVVLLAGHLVAHIGRALATADLAERAALLQEPPNFVGVVLMGIAFLIAVFYSLDVLYSERRDRSILFWKSLPVSDRMTVFAVAAVPVLVIPLFVTVLTMITQFVMLVLSSLALSASDLPVGPLWERARFFESTLVNLFHMIGVHGLWYSPLYGWLLLVSAWAQRLPFLWAVLPPLVIVALEKIVFGTLHIGGRLAYRMSGGAYGEVHTMDESMHALGHFSLAEFLVDPGLWLGLGVTVGLLLLAARIRNRREPG